MSSQDFIEQHPVAVKIIDDEKLYTKLLEDPAIEPIIVVLREGPLTLDEIESRYNLHVEKRLLPRIEKAAEDLEIPSDKVCLAELLNEISCSDKDSAMFLEKDSLSPDDHSLIRSLYKECKINKEKKSVTSIYRYIKKLEEHDLVFQVGRRIESGGRTTKALYGRTAKIFIPSIYTKAYWNSSRSLKIIESITKILALTLGKEAKESSIDCLKEVIKSLDKASSHEVADLMQDHNDEITEITKGMGFKEMDKIYDWIGTLVLLLNAQEYTEKIRECFG